KAQLKFAHKDDFEIKNVDICFGLQRMFRKVRSGRRVEGLELGAR
ncbi:hypothetical protein Pgy4_30891, partial [Pseudomonas savastanoi pv. glycinea str. race 4]